MSKRASRWLRALEVVAVLFLLLAIGTTLVTLHQLNDAYRLLQQADLQALRRVTAPPTGQVAAVEGLLPARLPAGAAYLSASGRNDPLPLPTAMPLATPNFVPAGWEETETGKGTLARGPAPATRIQIPQIGVDSHILPGTDARALKLGVGQFGVPVAPGGRGNLVLAAHNDSYGAVFRHLGDLQPGAEIRLSSAEATVTYVVRERLVVEPDAVWVTYPTSQPTLTLITCFPYPLNTDRLVLFADLATP